jgi:YL1 nuclear protein/YL1 nuclear protein C-terminal domain
MFAEVANDIDFEEQVDVGDVFDSDFDETDEDEAEQEDEGERELQAATKVRKRTRAGTNIVTDVARMQASKGKSTSKRSAMPKALSNVRMPPAPSRAAPSSILNVNARRREREERRIRGHHRPAESFMTGLSDTRRVRKSARSATVKNEALLRDRMEAERKERQQLASRAKQAEPKAKKVRLTQDMLIAEALEVEEANRQSLQDFLRMEEDRRSRARVVKKTKILGPFLRWRSIAEQPGEAEQVHILDGAQEAQDVDGPSAIAAERKLLEDPAILARDAWKRARDAGKGRLGKDENREETYERTHISVHDLPEDASWADEFEALLGSHTDWSKRTFVPSRGRPAQPRRSNCPITGLPAKYRDSVTGIPIANDAAARILREVLQGDYAWTGGAQDDTSLLGRGAYMERFGSAGAVGVFEGFCERLSMPQEQGRKPSKQQKGGSLQKVAKSEHHELSQRVPGRSPAIESSNNASTREAKRKWGYEAVADIAPGDEKSLLYNALALPAGSTRSGRSRAAQEPSPGNSQAG